VRKFDKHTRLPILEKLESHPNEVLACEAYCTAINDSWATFHSVTSSKLILAKHINLPLFLLEISDKIKPGDRVAFDAFPSKYEQKGISRGTFKPLNDERKILVRIL
jgi:hypothetical protein